MHSYGYRLAALGLFLVGAAAAQPPTGPGPAPAPQPGATQASQPGATQTSQPGATQAAQPGAIPAAQPGATAASQPGGRSSPQPAANLSGFPWQNETLHYVMNWQSGLPVGEVNFTARKMERGGWSLEVAGNAGVLGFAVNDRYRSTTGADLCSIELLRETDHAGRKGTEKSTFDQKTGAGHRVTLLPKDGGETDFFIGPCARDAVAFAYFARMELGQGRVPASAQTYLGAAYSTSMVYTGAQDIVVDGKKVTTDRLNVAVKGPKADFHFEVAYARDPARTPMQIRVPLSMGTFTLDLVR